MAWSPFKPQQHGGQLVRRKQGQPIYKKDILGEMGRGPAENSGRLQAGLKHSVTEKKVLELAGRPTVAWS